MNSGNYEKAKELSDRISLLKGKAIQVNKLINEVQSRIESSLAKGFNVYEAQQFLNLAVSSLMRETLMKLKSLPKKRSFQRGLHPALANQA